jgi:hypothetical protein
MEAIKHPTSNTTLGPAKGDEETVETIFATRVNLTDGDPPQPVAHIVVTYWQPSASDLILIGQGRPVRLEVVGVRHPPVRVGVEGDGTLPGIDRAEASLALSIENIDQRLSAVEDIRELPIGALANKALDFIKAENPTVGAVIILHDALAGINCTMDNLDTPDMTRNMLLSALAADAAARDGEGVRTMTGPRNTH